MSDDRNTGWLLMATDDFVVSYTAAELTIQRRQYRIVIWRRNRFWNRVPGC